MFLGPTLFSGAMLKGSGQQSCGVLHHVPELCAKLVCSSSQADLERGVQKMLMHIFTMIQSQRRKKSFSFPQRQAHVFDLIS